MYGFKYLMKIIIINNYSSKWLFLTQLIYSTIHEKILVDVLISSDRNVNIYVTTTQKILVKIHMRKACDCWTTGFIITQTGWYILKINQLIKGEIFSQDRTLCCLKLIPTHTLSKSNSTENDIDTRLTKAWTAIDRLSIIWKSDLTDKMKRSFFQAVVVSILLYGGTTWTLTKRLEKKLDGNYTRMLRAILNKSWRQHPRRHQLYGHLPPITKTIQVRRSWHAGYCWRSKDKLISDVLQWTPTYGQAKAGRPARTFIQQLCEDTGCNPEDLPEAMNDRKKWRERVRDIRAGGTTWWWWWWWW